MALIPWALRRQIFDIGLLVVFFSLFGYLIVYPVFNKPPTCFDGRQNGDEAGVDCGGSCARACLSQVDEVSVLWTRAFRVVPGRYNAVAYLENHNVNTAVNKINYRFRFADQNNIYIGKREGSTYIPPSGKFAVFEPAIDMGHSIPIYTTFEFTQTPEWVTIPQEKINQLQVSISNIILADENTRPRLFVTVKNNSLYIIRDMDVIAILYDANRNAVSASRTYLDQLTSEEAATVSFTWPEPFSREIFSKEIIPIYNIDSVRLK